MDIRRGRAFIALAALCSGCSATGDGTSSDVEGGELISCALDGAAAFEQVCAVERREQDGRMTLLVRHPDGAFRRFDVLGDGRGLAVADGADRAETRYGNGIAEIEIDGDRYRFPFTVKSNEANP